MVVEVCRGISQTLLQHSCLPFTTKMGWDFYEAVRWITISLSTMHWIHLDIQEDSLPGILRKQLQSLEGEGHDLSAWESLLWRGWVSLPKHAPQGQSSLSNPSGLSGLSLVSWLFEVCLVCINPSPVKDFDKERLENASFFTEYYTANLHVGAFMLPKYGEIFRGRKNRSFISCWMWGSRPVAISRFAKIAKPLQEIMIASRTKSKCDDLKA